MSAQGETRGATEAAPASSEHAPAALPAVETMLEKVFLTPRVVDQRAFDELASSLRALVHDAAAQGQGLLATTSEVKLLSDQLREATRELQQRVESAARVVPSLDERVGRAEVLLDRTGKELAAR